MVIAIYWVYTKVYSFVKYSSGFCVADVSKIKKSQLFMKSNVKFSVYGSYIFKLLSKNNLFNYISRLKYYILKSIESYSVYYEQVFIRLQQSNLHMHIWLIFHEIYTKIGYICYISILLCCSVSRVCFCSRWYEQFHRHT